MRQMTYGWYLEEPRWEPHPRLPAQTGVCRAERGGGDRHTALAKSGQGPKPGARPQSHRLQCWLGCHCPLWLLDFLKS